MASVLDACRFGAEASAVVGDGARRITRGVRKTTGDASVIDGGTHTTTARTRSSHWDARKTSGATSVSNGGARTTTRHTRSTSGGFQIPHIRFSLANQALSATSLGDPKSRSRRSRFPSCRTRFPSRGSRADARQSHTTRRRSRTAPRRARMSARRSLSSGRGARGSGPRLPTTSRHHRTFNRHPQKNRTAAPFR
jgi:hypothetical protein